MSFSWEPDPRSLAEARLSGLLQSLTDALLLEDEDRRILLVNQAFCTLFAIPAPPDALKGYDCAAAVRETKHLFADPDGTLGRIDALLAARTPVHGEIVHMADGRIVERDYIPVFLDHVYRGHLWRYRDITAPTRARERVATLSAVSRALVDAHHEQDAHARVIDAVCRGLGWPMGASYVETEGAARLRAVATYASPDLPADAAARYERETREVSFAPGEGLPGRVWREGRAVWAANVQDEPGFVRAGLAREGGLVSMALVPVRFSAQSLGVLEFVATRHVTMDPEMRDLLEGVGDQLGQVIGRMRARAELADREASLRAILDSALDAILSVDVAGRVTEFNTAAERILGFSREEVLGRPLGEVIVPHHLRQAHEHGFARHLRTGESRVLGQRLELTALKKDGSVIPAEVSIVRIDREGTPAFTGFIRDISDRVAREHALAASEGRTRAVIEQMLEGLLLVDEATGVIRLVNPAAEKMFGYEPGQMIGRHVRTLMPSRPEYAASDFLTRATEQALGRTTEWEALHTSGRTFPFELQLSALDTADGRVLAGFVRDLTERHAVERLKKQFVSTVSHELRTPLTSIRGSLGLLSSGALGALGPDALRLVEIAERNVVRLVGLINDILDLERLESGRMQMHLAASPIDAILTRSVEAVAAMASGGGVRIDTANATAMVTADADRIVQVVVNLLSNAVKFSPPGGTVTVRTAAQGPDLLCDVLDEGPGVPAEYRDLIFEPFRQAESTDVRQKGGSGLGLAICRAIVEQHGGRIGMEPREGGGSRFWFTVPLAAPGSAQP